MGSRFRYSIIAISLFLFSLICHADTWNESIPTEISSTVIGAGASTSTEIVLGQESITGNVAQQTDTQTGDITTDDETVTDTVTSNIEAGWEVSGSGIPADTTVASITSGTEFEMSAAATATTNDVSLSFEYDYDNVITSTVTENIHEGMTVNGRTVSSVDSGTQLTLASNIAYGDSQSLTAINPYESLLIQVEITEESACDGAEIRMYKSADDGNTFDTTPFETEILEHVSGSQAWSYIVYQKSTPRIKLEITNPAAETGENDDITVTVMMAGRDAE